MKPRKPFELLLFDLDGTLVDTAPAITAAVNGFLAERQRPGVSEETVRGWIGHGTRRLLQQALTYASVPSPDGDELEPLALTTFERHYLEHCGSSHAYDEVVETLHELRGDGLRLAVVTNKEERFTLPVLDAAGLRSMFDLIVCGDTLTARKPDPMPVLHCIQKLEGTPARTLLVGDSEIDVATARNAGIAVWAVPYGYNGHRPIETARPDRIIPGFASLAEALA